MRRTTSISNMGLDLPNESFRLSQSIHGECINPASTLPPGIHQEVALKPTSMRQTEQSMGSKHSCTDPETEEKQAEKARSILSSPRSALQMLFTAARQLLWKEPTNSAQNEFSLSPFSQKQASDVHPVTQEKKDLALDQPDFKMTSPYTDYHYSTFNMCATALDSDARQSNNREFLFESATSVGLSLPAIDFLDACHHCKRQLRQGFDIFMYRGDQAFCSAECRHRQILMDERNEIVSSLRSGFSGVTTIPARHPRTYLAGRTVVTA